MFGYQVLGFGGIASNTWSLLSSSTRWLDIDIASAEFTFSGSNVTCASATKSVRFLYTFGGLGTTDARDNFPFKYQFDVGATTHGGRIGIYDLAEEDTLVVSSGSGASMNSMTNSWHIQPFTGELYKGGTLVATLGSMASSTCSFNVAEDGTVTFVKNGTVLHTFASGVGSTVAIRPMFGCDTASRTISNVTFTGRKRFQADFGTFRRSAGTNYNVGATDGAAGFRFTSPKRIKPIRVQWSHSTGTAAESYNHYFYSDDGASPSHPSALLETSTDTQSHSSTGAKTWEHAGSVTFDAGDIIWSVLPDFTSAVTYSSCAGVTGYASGRSNTAITSIASSGQNPELATHDWRVRIVGWVNPGDA